MTATAPFSPLAERLFAAVEGWTTDGDWTVVEHDAVTFYVVSPEGKNWGSHATRALAAHHAGVAARVRDEVENTTYRGGSLDQIARAVVVAAYGERVLAEVADDEELLEVAAAVLRVR